MRNSILLGLILLAASAARADDYATRMLAATVKIYHKDSTAAGFLVIPPAGIDLPEKQVLLVTAGHVLERVKGDDVLLVLRKRQDDGTYTRSDFKLIIREGAKELWIKHPTEDIAVIAVGLPAGVEIRPIDFESLADVAALRKSKLHIGSELLVLGFPMRFESNGAGFPVARHASVASFPLLPVEPHKIFLADFTTFAGDSGGPVFIADPSQKDLGEDARPLVVGIVLAQHFSDEKINGIYEEQTLRHPLNLSTIVHAEFVRQTIEKFRK